MSVAAPSPVRLTVFVAGTNDPSNADFLADRFMAGVRSMDGVIVEKVRIRDLQLAHFTLEHYGDGQQEADFVRVQQLIEGSAAVVFFSPVWNFSVPAHFKNLLDRMGAFGLDRETRSEGQFAGKPFAFIYTGGAPMIAWKALMYLTTLHIAEAIKYYGGSVIYRHYEPRCLPSRGHFGLVVDQRPKTLALMEWQGKRFALIAQQYAKDGSLPTSSRLWQWWFTQLYRIGNRIMYPIGARQ
jgi:multimeric flavodoxin WrbA